MNLERRKTLNVAPIRVRPILSFIEGPSFLRSFSSDITRSVPVRRFEDLYCCSAVNNPEPNGIFLYPLKIICIHVHWSMILLRIPAVLLFRVSNLSQHRQNLRSVLFSNIFTETRWNNVAR